MRVALDCTALLANPTGVGAFTATLVEGLAHEAGVEPLAFALTWRKRGGLADAVPDGVEVCTRPLPARPLRELWLRTDRPRLDHLIGRHDLVHGANFVAPPSRAPALVTVHDLTAVLFPELCTRDTLEFPALIRRAIARGAWVHVVSAQVRDEVIDHFDVDDARVRIVPNAVPAGPAGDPDAGHALAGVTDYVAALGTVEPRKDLPTLVRAFDLVAADHHDLWLIHAGPDGWATREFEAAVGEARHGDRVRRLGYVSDADRADLLAGARAFAYPSSYEGFGIPPLEAMAAGIPVVTSDAAALVEVTGDAAIHAPVGDAGALAQAIERVVTDEGTRTHLISVGRRRAASFSPQRLVEGMVTVYRDVLGA